LFLVEQLEAFADNSLLLTIQDGKFICKDLASPDVDIPNVIERAGAGGVVRNISNFSLIVETFTSSSGASTSVAQLCLVQKKKMLLYYWHKSYFKELKEIIIDEVPKTGRFSFARF